MVLRLILYYSSKYIYYTIGVARFTSATAGLNRRTVAVRARRDRQEPGPIYSDRKYVGDIGVLQSPYGRGQYIVARNSQEAATTVYRTRGLTQLDQVARGGSGGSVGVGVDGWYRSALCRRSVGHSGGNFWLRLWFLDRADGSSFTHWTRR